MFRLRCGSRTKQRRENMYEQFLRFMRSLVKGSENKLLEYRTLDSDKEVVPLQSIEPRQFSFDSSHHYIGYLTSLTEKGMPFKGVIQIFFHRVERDAALSAAVSKAEAKLEIVGSRHFALDGCLEVHSQGLSGRAIFVSKKGIRLRIKINQNQMEGDLTCRSRSVPTAAKSYKIVGWRELAESSDFYDQVQFERVLKRWQHPLVLAWKCDPYADKSAAKVPRFAGWNCYTFQLGAKGSVKVCGLMVDGTKLQTDAKLVIAEDGTIYLPVVLHKKEVEQAFNLVWPPAGAPYVWGANDVQLGEVKQIVAQSYVFNLEEGYPLWGQLGGGFPYTEYLPNGMRIQTTDEGKWMTPPSGKLILDQYGHANRKKLGDNPSGLTLDYHPNDGTFKGTFKVYVSKRGWPKPWTVQIQGVMVDGLGYGTAFVKGIGSVPVLLN